jgi:CubicO group peptidase (beta-lactamase class C family)
VRRAASQPVEKQFAKLGPRLVTDPFQAVAEFFVGQQARGAFPGGQLVVMREGQVVCDVACGVARGHRGEEPGVFVTSDTRFQVMSASKPFVGLAIALLDDAGLLDVEAPVARYFPEFGQNGKQQITVADVLVHRSGVLLEELQREPELWSDWDSVVAAMANARASRRRGTLAYSPAGFGWILAEVVRRVAQQPLQEFLLSRLPASLRNIRFVDASLAASAAYSYWLGPQRFMLAGRDIAADFEEVNNSITCVTACVPGAGLLATARELAMFYDLLVAGGRGVIGTETLGRYTTQQTSGFEWQLKVPLQLGRGFGLGSFGPHAFGWWNTRPCFGHAGGFGVVAFADPRTKTAVAAVTNGHRGVGDMLRRFAPLGSRIRRAALAAG